MFSLAIIPQIVPQDTVPPVLKVQIFYSATPRSHLPRFNIRCRVGATFVFVFTDTGKITAVIFTSSSGVLFILSQWNRKAITIQSTRRSICHTTNSGETMPDMTVDQRFKQQGMSRIGCYSIRHILRDGIPFS